MFWHASISVYWSAHCFSAYAQNGQWVVTGYTVQGKTTVGPSYDYACVGDPLNRGCKVTTDWAETDVSGPTFHKTHTTQEAAGFNNSQELYVGVKGTVVSAQVEWVGADAPPAVFTYRELSVAKLKSTGGWAGSAYARANNGFSETGGKGGQGESNNGPEGVFRSVAAGTSSLTIPINRDINAELDFVVDGGVNPKVDVDLIYAIVPATKPLIHQRPPISATRPTDKPASSGCGPSCGDPVDLASGDETLAPAPDLAIYNPTGISVTWARSWSQYRAMHGEAAPGWGGGWTHAYDWTIAELPDYNLALLSPLGARELMQPALDVNGQPAGVFDRSTRNDSSSTNIYQVELQTRAGSGIKARGEWTETYYNTRPNVAVYSWGDITLAYEDGSQQNFISKRLAIYRNSLGQSLAFFYGGSPKNPVLQQISDGTTGQPLLLLAYDIDENTGASLIQSVIDRNGRRIVYGFDAQIGVSSPVLRTVSQIALPSETELLARWRYDYTSYNGITRQGVPLVSAITMPHPNGGAQTSTARIFYNDDAQVAALQDANGNRREYSYASYSTLVTVKNAAGVVESTESDHFDALGRSTGVTDALNHSTQIVYNSNFIDRVAAATDEMGRTTHFGYDGRGNMTSVTTPRGIVTTYTYNGANFGFGRLIATQEADKPGTSIDYYEPSGLVKSVTTPHPGGNGFVTSRFNYDPMGNLSSNLEPGLTDDAPRWTTFLYEKEEISTLPFDGLAVALAAGQDFAPQIGHPIAVTDAMGRTTHFRYDEFGNVRYKIDANGNRTTIFYNRANQPIRALMPATGQTGTGNTEMRLSYAFTGGPQLRAILLDEAGQQQRLIRTIYGAEGEILRTVGDASDEAVEYDALYRAKTFRDARGRATSYVYDLAGRLREARYPRANDDREGFDREQFTNYDASGQLLQKIDGRGVVTDFVYDDPEGQLTQTRYPASPAENVTLGYDNYGRLATRTDGAGIESYAYTAADALQSQTTRYRAPGGGWLPDWTQSVSYNADGSHADQTTPLGTTNYGYDAVGRWTKMTDWANRSHSWLYDRAGRMREARGPRGVRTNWEYNALDQVIAQSARQFLPDENGTTSQLLAQWGQSDNDATRLLYNARGQLVRQSAATTPFYNFGATTAYN